MSGTVLLKAKNEETLLPRVLRLFSKYGANVQELKMKAYSENLEVEIVLEFKNDLGQLSKLLTKQVSVVSVETFYV